MHTLELKKGKLKFIHGKHPWIFSGALHKSDENIEEGAVVEVKHQGKHICTGHYQSASIMVRILSYNEGAIDLKFYTQKLRQALALRKQLHLISSKNTICRIVHGEGDFLPGLVIDYYDGHFVVECHSIGMYKDRALIGAAIEKVFDEVKSIFVKSPKSNPIGSSIYLKGEERSTWAIENDLAFKVNWDSGQKTGFFIDQRDNRALVRNLAKEKTILNLFSYSGGFSIYGIAGGAEQVTSVDISPKANALLEEHIYKNNQAAEKHEIHTADVMTYLKQADRTYDMTIVDPPAFAKSVKKRHNAVQAYKRLNMRAIHTVNPGGLMLTFSCSQVVSPTLFYNTIKSAAIESGRSIQVLQQLSQGADHPVSITHDEGHYLKGLLFRVC